MRRPYEQAREGGGTQRTRVNGVGCLSRGIGLEALGRDVADGAICSVVAQRREMLVPDGWVAKKRPVDWGISEGDALRQEIVGRRRRTEQREQRRAPDALLEERLLVVRMREERAPLSFREEAVFCNLGQNRTAHGDVGIGGSPGDE